MSVDISSPNEQYASQRCIIYMHVRSVGGIVRASEMHRPPSVSRISNILHMFRPSGCRMFVATYQSSRQDPVYMLPPELIFHMLLFLDFPTVMGAAARSENLNHLFLRLLFFVDFSHELHDCSSASVRLSTSKRWHNTETGSTGLGTGHLLMSNAGVTCRSPGGARTFYRCVCVSAVAT